ncbi:RING/U-box superfamily protein [Striga asiatica]|uniref:RING/U-box superfamily protein n=1 Tax=Striga asiatica TaxID=4170 RepID=A0A5A7QVP6_STRAF|nr:RING/U-box superfamily protein [Striga asiatica]
MHMATISQFLSHIYTTTMIFFSTLFIELALIFLYSAAKISARRKSTPTEQIFLEIIGQKSHEYIYKTEPPFELHDHHEECSVCLSLFEQGDEVRNLKCNHTFHKDCIDTWLQRESATCPLCRGVVLPPEMVVGRLCDPADDDGDEVMAYFDMFAGNWLIPLNRTEQMPVPKSTLY